MTFPPQCKQFKRNAFAKPPLSAAMDCRGATEPLRRARRQQTTTRLRLLRERTGAEIGRQVAHEGRGAADRGEYRTAALLTKPNFSCGNLATWVKQNRRLS